MQTGTGSTPRARTNASTNASGDRARTTGGDGTTLKPEHPGEAVRVPSARLKRAGVRLKVPAARLRSALAEPFQLPTVDDPAPPVRQMILVSSWAALLTLIGLAVAVRAFLATMFTDGLPGWFIPAVSVLGTAGIVLTILAFSVIRRPRAPLTLLGGASAALLATMTATAIAL